MSRRTFTATVEVTIEDAPEDYRNSRLADDIRDAVFDHLAEESELGIVVMQVSGTDHPQPAARARTAGHAEAQELHRILGGILEDLAGGGQYDLISSYEDKLERARELAATYVADTDPDQ